MLTVGSLFSGIGGFDLGLERAGFKIKWQVEINEFCQKILTKHWPKVPKFRDIRDCGEHNLEAVDLICGGFPCQPFSIAGKRKGKEDERALWPEMLRVISELKPAWVVGENVAGFISLGLDDCLSDLENQGYETQAFIIPACAINAPHKRDRVWIVAYAESSRNNNNGRLRTKFKNGDRREVVAGNEIGVYKKEILTYAASARLEGTLRQSESGDRGRFTAQDRGQSQIGDKDWFKITTKLCRVDNGLSSRLHKTERIDRLKALGNAVVPQIPEIIGRMILESA